MGCEKRKRVGYVGVDKLALDGVDVVHDLNAFPYPFEDDSINEVLLTHVLKHLPDTICVMEEVWRICRSGAAINIVVPYYNSPEASQDPTHVRFFTEKTFDYFTLESSYNFYTKARFQIASM